jgi:hypothetical protein
MTAARCLLHCIDIDVFWWGESRPRKAFVPVPGRETIRRVTVPAPPLTKAKRRQDPFVTIYSFGRRILPSLRRKKTTKNNAIPSNVFSDLSSANVTLPCTSLQTNASPSVPDSVNFPFALAGGTTYYKLRHVVAEYGSEITLESLLELPTATAIVDYPDRERW